MGVGVWQAIPVQTLGGLEQHLHRRSGSSGNELLYCITVFVY